MTLSAPAAAQRADGVVLRLQRLDRSRVVDVAIGLVVVATLTLPVLLSNRAFFGDWGNHLYLVDQQTRWLRHHAFPTYYVHSAEAGAFYPHYMFYGGSLYAVTGWLGVIVGSVNAFRLTFVFGFSACYFGTLSVARQLGVRSLLAHVPAILAVSGAYFVSKAYNDGGWPEFIAASMIPLILATALSVIRTKRVPLASAILLVVGTFLLTGSHTLTVVAGLSFLALLAAIAGLLYRRSITRTHLRRLAVVGALMALAAALNAWFLVPLARYASLTVVGTRSPAYHWRAYDYATRSLDSFWNVFNPLRTYPAPSRGNGTPFYVQVPVYALLWLACLAVFLLVRRRRSRTVTLFWALLAVLAVLLTLVVWRGAWDLLPSFFKLIQFRYRLDTYINFTVVGLVVVGLILVAGVRRSRPWILAACLAAGAALGLAAWQAWSAPTFLKTTEVVKDGNHLPLIDYTNCRAPCTSVLHDYRIRGIFGAGAFEKRRVHISSARTDSAEILLPAAGPYQTNVVWSPTIEMVGPARIIGATGDGWAVIAAEPGSEPTSFPVRASFRPRTTAPIVAGRVISVCAAAILALWLIVAVALRARRRRARWPDRSGSERVAGGAGVAVEHLDGLE